MPIKLCYTDPDGETVNVVGSSVPCEDREVLYRVARRARVVAHFLFYERGMFVWQSWKHKPGGGVRVDSRCVPEREVPWALFEAYQDPTYRSRS